MNDIIKLLPDAIANQIAAGEVIQRPASAVKELLENSIDAGSTRIQLIIKDAGKTLIQIIDNGCGMSETDARLCFERHATSKINNAHDLFSIRTLGFRGEAMASIAAVAQVELKTKQAGEALGIRIVIEGSEVKIQEPCQCPQGTSIAIKNLFFNIPARRNFLKSQPVETRHIIEEFQRVALANAKINFSFYNNEVALFQLTKANLRKRIVGIFGNNFNERLVPIEEGTDFLKIYGFVGKPQYARKSRGDQYFFVNERFIKSAYLNHAVVTAYAEVLAPKTYPFYVIFIDIDPARIDVNVHPTKQEIKFDDEKVVYTFINAAVRKALAAHHITPSIDFDQAIHLNFGQGPQNRNNPSNKKNIPPPPPPISWQASDLGKNERTSSFKTSPLNTSNSSNKKRTPGGFQHPIKPKVPSNWQELYKTENIDFSKKEKTPVPPETITFASKLNQNNELITDDAKTHVTHAPAQIHARYILTSIKSGFILIDQQAAHERVLYERYKQNLSDAKGSTQKQLFPQTIELPTADAALLKEILPEINALGYDIQEFGQNTFVLHGIPSDVSSAGKIGNEQQSIEQLIEQYKFNLSEFKLDKRQGIARTMARQMSIKKGHKLSKEEMQSLVDQLFACHTPFTAPNGQPTFVTYSLEDIEKRFKS